MSLRDLTQSNRGNLHTTKNELNIFRLPESTSRAGNSSLRALCNKAKQSPNKLRKKFIWVAYKNTTTMQKVFQAA
ncbi:MAG: hypothetical protein J6W29_04495 [Neisseriaceae bacterium]|nr:hypothetical protein [Neisseriaceae bacterium]